MGRRSFCKDGDLFNIPNLLRVVSTPAEAIYFEFNPNKALAAEDSLEEVRILLNLNKKVFTNWFDLSLLSKQ